MVTGNKFLKFFNHNWLLLSLLVIFMVITVKVYDNGVITGEWNVCKDNGGVMLSSGECVDLDITDNGYSICKLVVYQDEVFFNVSI